jgi:hypothetical protein
MFNYRPQFIQLPATLALLLGIAIVPQLPSQASDVTQVLGADLNWQCGELQPSLRVFPEAGNREIRMNFLPCHKEEPAAQNSAPPPVSSQPDITQLSQQLVQQGVQILQVGQPIIRQVLQQLSSPVSSPTHNPNVQIQTQQSVQQR